MRAFTFDNPGIEHIVTADLPDPGEPGGGEIRVRIKASSLNGHDYNVIMGRLPVERGRILLTDGAGVVESVGAGVTELNVGDEVISTFFPDWEDGFAPRAGFSRTPGDGLDGHGVEAVVRPARWYTRAPNGWSLEEAATLPTAGLTAWRALVVEGELRPGQDVLILGTGGVSILALQMAKRMGARVTITSSSDDKLARARKLGADATINYKQYPEWASEVLRLTEGRGADLVLEMGGPGTLPQSIGAARIGGRIVLIGVVTGITGNVPTAALMGKQLRMTGITVGSRTHQLDMVRWLNEVGLRPHLDLVFSYGRLTDALRLQESGKHLGKICLVQENS